MQTIDPRIPKSSACIITPLSEENYSIAARLYTDVFLADEPTSHRHAPDPTMFFPFAEYYTRSLIQKNLSFVALDMNTHEMTGFIFGVDLAFDIRDEGEEMVRFLTHFKETVELIEELETRFLDISTIKPGSVLHVYQIGVKGIFRNRGIARSLINEILKTGQNRGYQKVIADCTCQASERSFESCGFMNAGTIPYETYMVNGTRFFSGLKGGISLMIKDI